VRFADCWYEPDYPPGVLRIAQILRIFTIFYGLLPISGAQAVSLRSNNSRSANLAAKHKKTQNFTAVSTPSSYHPITKVQGVERASIIH
jgi:hypothetical protein